MTLSILLAAAAATISAPQPGSVNIYSDWYAACDNTGTCEAGSLPDIVETYVRVQRAAGHNGTLQIRVTTQQESIDRIALMIDGRDIATGMADGDASFLLSGDDLLSVARLLAKGRQAVIVNRTPGTSGDDVIATVSLAGSAAALRFADARQQRDGTRDAIVARGDKPDRSVAAELPVIPNILPPKETKTAAAPVLTENIVEQVLETTECWDQRPSSPELDSAHPLASGNGMVTALVLAGCGSGAYNFNSRAYIATRPENDKSEWTFRPAQFDYPADPLGHPEDGETLVNAFFDAENGVLGSYSKARGLGDCGNTQSYVWDGSRFRLIEAAIMPECRGVWQWPVVWRAKPAHEAPAPVVLQKP